MTQYILNKAPSYSGAWHIWTGDNVLCGQLTLKHIVHNSLTTEIPSSVCKSCLAIARKAYTKQNGKQMNYGVGNEEKNILKQRREHKCKSPDYKQLSLFIPNGKPNFECQQCKTIWQYGDGIYAELVGENDTTQD